MQRDIYLGEGHGGTKEITEGVGEGLTEQQVPWQGTSPPPLPQNRSRKHRPVTLPGTGLLLA